jgi:hypothetical protein
LILIMALAGWILVAAAFSLLLGRSIRDADVQECPWPPTARRAADAPAARRYVQTSLFDPARDSAEAVAAGSR